MRRVEGKSFKELIEDNINYYINLPIETRLQFCLQFVEGMNILYSLTIIHADINSQNLMIDLNSKRLTIIDLDGGAVAKTGSSPVVIAQREPGWVAPEIFSQLLETTDQQEVNVEITADLWSIACGVHQLLFGLAPFFFINSQPDIKKYLQTYKWPQIIGIKGIKIVNNEAFGYHKRNYAKVPKLHNFFEGSFCDGYLNHHKRISAYHWMQAIKSELGLIHPPRRQTTILNVKIKSDQNIEDSEKNLFSIYIPSIIALSILLPVIYASSTTFILEAILFGILSGATFGILKYMLIRNRIKFLMPLGFVLLVFYPSLLLITLTATLFILFYIFNYYCQYINILVTIMLLFLVSILINPLICGAFIGEIIGLLFLWIVVSEDNDIL